VTALREVIARSGVVECLQYLSAVSETAFERFELENRIRDLGVGEAAVMVDQLLAADLIASYGDRLGISALGLRTQLLIEALEGGDIDDICYRLRRIDGRDDPYVLVREGMTKAFFQTLLDRPGFRRLYICSPWINPSDREAAILKYVYFRAIREQLDSPEVLVIARPPDAAPLGTDAGLKPFTEIGAQLFFNRRLHSKLYIREPDRRGGVSLAIVGSQNLTRSAHLELGIRINGDTRLIEQLIVYFLDVMNRSEEQE